MKNDAEISRKLALAIGWSDADPEDPDVVIFRATLFGQYLEDYCAVWFESDWRTFDYRDPSVIWPIAEKFDAFPRKSVDNPKGWASVTSEFWINGGEFSYADTAAKAVALAVIKHCEGK